MFNFQTMVFCSSSNTHLMQKRQKKLYTNKGKTGNIKSEVVIRRNRTLIKGFLKMKHEILL